MDDRLEGVVYPFEDIGDELSLLPLSARRALDRAGMRLSLEAYQALHRPSRVALALEGAKEVVEADDVQRAIRNAMPPPTRIKPVPDPDPLSPPEQLNHALGPRRAVSPAQWAKLRSLDRYALVHVMRRSIAHNDPARLDAAAELILKGLGRSGLSEPPASRGRHEETEPELPPGVQRALGRRGLATSPAARAVRPDLEPGSARACAARAVRSDLEPGSARARAARAVRPDLEPGSACAPVRAPSPRGPRRAVRLASAALGARRSGLDAPHPERRGAHGGRR